MKDISKLALGGLKFAILCTFLDGLNGGLSQNRPKNFVIYFLARIAFDRVFNFRVARIEEKNKRLPKI